MNDFAKKMNHYFEQIETHKTQLEDFLMQGYFANNADKVNMTKNLEKHVYGRARFFFNSILPWVDSFFPLSDLSLVEIGPGTGSTTAPLAMCARQVHAYDISSNSSDVAKLRCDLLGLPNAEVTAYPPDQILARIVEKHDACKVDGVILFAVLEHMKLEERINTLRTAWSILKDGGFLMIGDTPNRLTYAHGHTARLPFFDMIPDELACHYLDQMGNTGFAEAWRRWIADGESPENITDRIDRWGRGVSFHEFEIALGLTQPLVVAEGFERPMVRAMPVTLEEKLHMTYLHRQAPHIPLGFARQSLYLIFQKNGDNRLKAKQYNEDLLRSLLSL